MSYFLVLLLAIICFSSAALISSHTSSNSQTLSGVMSLERYYYPAKDNNNTTVEKLAEARDRVRHHTRFLRDSTPTEKGVIQFPLYKYSFDFDPSLVGLYYTRVRLGSPPQEYNMLIDTGSHLSWISCSSCINCPRTSGLGVKMNFYDAQHSSTSMLTPCSFDSCHSCDQNQCSYSLTYGDHSTADDYLVSDELYLDTMSSSSEIPNSSRIYFGCSTSRTGNLGLIALDGLLGFGRLGISIIAQLSSHRIAPKAFSHCLKGEGSGGGILVLGEILHPRMVYTPLVPSKSLYNVYLESVAVQGRTLPIDPAAFASSGDRGTFFDSGTTFVHLVQEAYEAVIGAITIAVSPSAKLITSGRDPCYIISLRLSNNITSMFPTISLNFAGGASMDLRPADYLTHVSFSEDAAQWCILHVTTNPSLTIIGDVALRNRAVVYDLARQRVGWADYNCSLPVNVSISSGIDRVAHPAAFDYIIELFLTVHPVGDFNWSTDYDMNYDLCLKELQKIQEKKLVLESQITESTYAEKELEGKIIQAVELLISFRKQRDEMQIERDNAIKEVNRFRKLVQDDIDEYPIKNFFSLSFSDITEATKNFDPSSKVKEGKFGSVYKGIINHVKVAIKMLPACGSVSDSDFQHKAESLRHPNLVNTDGDLLRIL